MDTKQPEALRIADAIAIGRLSADDVEITGRELRRLHTENEQLRTCNKDAQHEIANLQARAQELGKAARDVNSRRVQELEAQLAAIGAGGVEPLRKRCLHKISEPPMTAETATTDTNTPELEVKSPAALPAKNLELLRERIEALQSEKESLYAALVKESIRAANEKLRAEKMALQHRMQADMHISACKELASLRAAAHKPLADEQIEKLCAEIGFTNWPEWDGGTFQEMRMQLARAIEAAHGITAAQKGGKHGTD